MLRRCLLVAVLLATALTAGCEPPPTQLAGEPLADAVPPTQDAIRQAISDGVQYLVDHQMPDGHWGSVGLLRNVGTPSSRDSESFQMATTSLCVKALIETAGDDPDALAALAHGEQWLIKYAPLFRRQALRSLFSNWGHIYALDALVAMYVHRPMDDARRAEVGRLIEDQMRQLAAGRTIRGGWGYYNGPPYTRPPSNWATSFMTSAALIAYHNATEAGFEAPRAAVASGLMALQWARFPNNAFSYTLYTIPKPITRSSWPQAAAGRSQAGNLAMHLYGDRRATLEVMKEWLGRFLSDEYWVAIIRKKMATHHYQFFTNAGYYYYFAFYHAALAAQQLEPEDRPYYQDGLARILLARQDRDGCWWDFVLYDYHKYYGTAYALMALQRCLQPDAAP